MARAIGSRKQAGDPEGWEATRNLYLSSKAERLLRISKRLYFLKQVKRDNGIIIREILLHQQEKENRVS